MGDIFITTITADAAAVVETAGGTAAKNSISQTVGKKKKKKKEEKIKVHCQYHYDHCQPKSTIC